MHPHGDCSILDVHENVILSWLFCVVSGVYHPMDGILSHCSRAF